MLKLATAFHNSKLALLYLLTINLNQFIGSPLWDSIFSDQELRSFLVPMNANDYFGITFKSASL